MYEVTLYLADGPLVITGSKQHVCEVRAAHILAGFAVSGIREVS